MHMNADQASTLAETADGIHQQQQRHVKAASAVPQPRKRSKQQGAGVDGSSGAPAAKRAKQGGAGGTGGGAKSKSKAGKDGDDEGLELVAKEDGRAEEEGEERLGRTHRGIFARDLPWLMYGYGDDSAPLKETVDLVEDIALQYMTDTVHAAMAAAAARHPTTATASGSGKRDELRLEDVMWAVRRDARKVARIQELMRRQQEIRDARKVLGGDAEGEDVPDL